MAIRVALNHRTRYRFNQPVGLGPHQVRLRPAPHCRAPILSYSLQVSPSRHSLRWLQDPFGNHVARIIFQDKASELELRVNLVADIEAIDPFDFLVERAAEQFPLAYPERLAWELATFLEAETPGPRLREWLDAFTADTIGEGALTVNVLVALNRRLRQDIAYMARLEPGVRTSEETLQLREGSCRDSAWLLVQSLRHLGVAARFVSGYWLQIVPEEGNSAAGPDVNLHAWAEAFLPGAGWIGLDPTSGLLTAEGHIPLACAIDPAGAVPVSGTTEPCMVELDFEVSAALIRQGEPD